MILGLLTYYIFQQEFLNMYYINKSVKKTWDSQFKIGQLALKVNYSFMYKIFCLMMALEMEICR
jgi:hypothetical protein